MKIKKSAPSNLPPSKAAKNAKAVRNAGIIEYKNPIPNKIAKAITISVIFLIK